MKMNCAERDMAAKQRMALWLQTLDSALQRRDVDSAMELFDKEECFWRDLVSFTWNVYTAESHDEVRAMLEATVEQAHPSAWAIVGNVHEVGDFLQCFVRFETRHGRGKGLVKLNNKDKCWCLLTTLQELKCHEEKTGPTREVGAVHGAIKGRKTWLEERLAEMEELGRTKQPYCLIIGGGQCGIALAARLRRLCVPTIIVEKNKRPGDSWRNRYKSLCVHTPVLSDHMPYIPYPEHWPKFASKDKIGDWLEAYVLAMELVYWTSTECKQARFNEVEQRWEVKLVRKGEGEIMLYPVHLVLSTGMSGSPNMPDFPGACHVYQGVQCHSSQFRSGDEWRGKHCAVIGSNNSAHDICAHLWECGAAEVTMIQRSPSHVFPSSSFVELMSVSYTGGHSSADGDLLAASVPFKLLPRYQIPIAKKAAEVHKDLYEGLEKVGFLHTFGEDDSGVMMLYLRQGSGYYIDVGATELIISGEIKLKSGVEVKEVKDKSLILSDGSEVQADLIVYATGYKSMDQWAAQIISKDVAEKVGKCWGLGSNTAKDPGPWARELRNMWKPTLQQNLWFHGGAFYEARQYSLYLALQLKARFEHIPTPVFGLAATKA